MISISKNTIPNWDSDNRSQQVKTGTQVRCVISVVDITGTTAQLDDLSTAKIMNSTNPHFLLAVKSYSKISRIVRFNGESDCAELSFDCGINGHAQQKFDRECEIPHLSSGKKEPVQGGVPAKFTQSPDRPSFDVNIRGRVDVTTKNNSIHDLSEDFLFTIPVA